MNQFDATFEDDVYTLKCIKHRQFGLAAIPSFYVFNTCCMLTTLFTEDTSGAGIQLLRTLEQKL